MEFLTVALGIVIAGMSAFVGIKLAELVDEEREQKPPKLSRYTPMGLLNQLELEMMEGES